MNTEPATLDERVRARLLLERSRQEKNKQQTIERELREQRELTAWRPMSVLQELTLRSEADILFLGGAAGSLKTLTILMDAVMERENPNLRAIIFRRKEKELADIIEKTRKWYPGLGGKFMKSEGAGTWIFPSGATVVLAFISTDDNIDQFLGARYSYMGWDESTLQTEKQIRDLFGRLGSTDKTLRLRVRLASNPGGQGALWHKKLFLRGYCPVHQKVRSAVPGMLYWDGRWPSDGVPLVDKDGKGFSVAFIPGLLTDHNLLDDKYIYRLRLMSAAMAPKMETGCWCELQGAYFGNWTPDKMVVPYASIQENWWDSHTISLDYGFGKSHAAAGLNVHTQQKRTFAIGELCVEHMGSKAFAREVVKQFVLPQYQGYQRRIVAVYLDPANFKHIDEGHSVAQQINEVLEEYGLGAIPAANDRVGGWQLMYNQLESGQYAIADTCPMTIESLPSRMHDPKKPGDLLKVAGDPLDDIADQNRYNLYSFVTMADKPREIRLAEHLATIPAEDLSSRLIRHQRFMAQERIAEQPVVLSGRGRMHLDRNPRRF